MLFSLPELETLSISDCPLQDAFSLAHIKSLYLSGGIPFGCLIPLHACPSLQELHLLGSMHVEDIAALASAVSLKTL
jgi:Leucine-rich repeat (LRR) protein